MALDFVLTMYLRDINIICTLYLYIYHEIIFINWYNQKYRKKIRKVKVREIKKQQPLNT